MWRLVLGILLVAEGGHAGPPRCPRDPAIVVDTTRHVLGLCEAGHVVRELPVALGGGGVGKRREGDRKTPLGSYALGAPRVSAKFHLFVPIGYPTRDQAARGLTGGDIGVHGPSRRASWLGRLRNWFDWTDGCIAVACDGVIDELASWIERVHARQIRID